MIKATISAAIVSLVLSGCSLNPQHESDGQVHVSAGINCATLNDWSEKIYSYRVNLHHIFCGELNKRKKAVGFHSRPGGNNPSTWVSDEVKASANAQGIYELKNIKLKLPANSASPKIKIKKRSTMFPDSCSQNQVVNSIVYARRFSGQCQYTKSAFCGPNAPAALSEHDSSYCVADNDELFDIQFVMATDSTENIHTAYPKYQPD